MGQTQPNSSTQNLCLDGVAQRMAGPGTTQITPADAQTAKACVDDFKRTHGSPYLPGDGAQNEIQVPLPPQICYYQYWVAPIYYCFGDSCDFVRYEWTLLSWTCF